MFASFLGLAVFSFRSVWFDFNPLDYLIGLIFACPSFNMDRTLHWTWDRVIHGSLQIELQCRSNANGSVWFYMICTRYSI